MSETNATHNGSWSMRLWGSRGGVSVCRPGTARYGGLTTCVAIELDGARIVIDAGSGLAELGRQHPRDRVPTLLLMTHLHWDHVVGLPHFIPLFFSGWSLDVRGVTRSDRAVGEFLLDVNRPPGFPVPLGETMRAACSSHELPVEGSDTWRGVRFSWTDIWHPGGCSAFRFELGGRVIVFASDMELGRFEDDARRRFAEFCDGAHTLILDAQYSDEEYPRHVGWGHSTNTQAARFAAEVGAERLLLTHHDPAHDDGVIDAMVAQAQKILPRTEGARCGMVIDEGTLDG